MKKLLSLVTVATLSLGGVVAASPAFAVGGNPTFDTSTLSATEGVAFDYTLTPTFSGSPSWYYGSRAFLDTESCDNLPAGLSYVQNAVENTGGVTPTYQISGTPDAGTAGTYNICFLTDDNPEGWMSIGQSQIVTLTVSAPAATPEASAIGGLDFDEGVAYSSGAPYTSANFAWTGTGTASAVGLPDGLTLSVDGYDLDGSPILLIGGTATAAGNYSVQITLTDGEQTATYEQIIDVWAAPVTPDYTIDCQAPAGAPYVNGHWAVDLPGTQQETVTVEIKNCGYHLVNDANGVYNEYVGTGTSTVYNVVINLSGYATVSGYNTWDEPVDASFTIDFSNVAPTEPTNGDNGSWDWGNTSFDNMYVLWDSAENGSSEISDADTEYTGDAYDGFGNLNGVNWDGSTFRIYATQEPTVLADSIYYISENIWSHDAQEYVDVTVKRTFWGNTLTWTVDVYKTGTETPSTLTMFIEGNLGSDGGTTWVSSNEMLTSSDDYSGDPVIIWNTNGIMDYSDGNDDVTVNFANASTATLSNLLLGYDGCPTTAEIQAYVDGITANYNANVDTNIADYQVCVPTSVTVNENATFTNGTNNSVDFTLNATGGWDWTYGGSLELIDLPNGLSYTVNNEWVDATVPSFTVYGTADAEPGEYTVTVNVWDDFSGWSSTTFTITVEAAAPASMTVSPETFTGVVGTEMDVTLDISTSGLNYAEGFEGSVEGLPAGVEYEFLTDEEGNVVGLHIFGTPTEESTGGLFIVVTDVNMVSASNDMVTWSITTAPVVIDAALKLDKPVGSNIADTGADYAAEGLKEGTEWTLTVRSTPQVIASGTVDASGLIAGVAPIPAGLEAGWHSITLAATDVNGNAITKVVWFELDANGKILAEQTTAPVIPEPALASTGTDMAGWLTFSMVLLMLGISTVAFNARRRMAKEEI